MGRLRWLTAGKSHGRTLAVTVEGVPAGLALERPTWRSISPAASAATAAALARRSSTTKPTSSAASATV